MAKEKKVEVGALNIKVQPHPPGIYVAIFEFLKDEGIIGGIYGDARGMIGSFAAVDEDENIYSGEILRFTNIDPRKPWLNLQTRKAIVTNDGKPIPQVDGDKRPNYRPSTFAFIPKHHRFFFNTSEISPRSAKKMLEIMFSHSSCISRFGHIDVELETSHEAIDKILKIQALKSIEIKITRPNADSVESERGRFNKRMEDQGIRTYEVNLSTGRGGGTIKPDDGTKELMRVANSEGSVRGRGYDSDDRPILVSTEKHPLIEVAYYDSDKGTFIGGFLEGARNLMRKIRSREH